LSAVQKRRIVLDGSQSAKAEGALMKRIPLVGYDPVTVDFSNPALPPGMTPETIHAGTAMSLRIIAERGWRGALRHPTRRNRCAATPSITLPGRTFHAVLMSRRMVGRHMS
jgi:hypothetical protein